MSLFGQYVPKFGKNYQKWSFLVRNKVSEEKVLRKFKKWPFLAITGYTCFFSWKWILGFRIYFARSVKKWRFCFLEENSKFVNFGQNRSYRIFLDNLVSDFPNFSRCLVSGVKNYAFIFWKKFIIFWPKFIQMDIISFLTICYYYFSKSNKINLWQKIDFSPLWLPFYVPTLLLTPLFPYSRDDK